ncbi:MAG: molybdopterin-guanine dinucleotide biosynthesis protein MobB [Spirochaetaceae bacterium]|nr:MAG: molybdopterin-guanine dinucleotide biosynthesis protein MobB [Spirochaetaceae bacterium]
MKQSPYLVCVTGLKNSGKTTVCTAVIADLIARGYSVAALKSSHVAKLRLDNRAGDSFALAESGARFVLVQGAEESLILERGSRSFRHMLRRVPEDVDFIISEGGEARSAAAVIVCLSDASAWEQTLRVRRVPRDRILALAGSFVRSVRAASPSGDDSGWETLEGFPLIDITTTGGRKALVQLILKGAGTG